MNERVIEDIVTKFLLNTYRLRPQLTLPATEAAVACITIGAEVDCIPLTTGFC